jgi:anaerobic magnesium-protoporphyrin IX monomethyl ester cyclase
MAVKRVVFFQPRTLAGENYQTAIGCEQRWAPWAALLLAPIVQRAGLEPLLIDARVDSSWRESLSSLGPGDLLAASVMTGHAIRDAVSASEIAHSCGARIVWGGPHVSLFPIETLWQAPVDGVMPGFGYAPLTNLLGCLVRGEWPCQSDGGVLVRPNESGPAKLTVPMPTRLIAPLQPPYLDLIPDWEPYVNPDIAIASRTANFITSEGCVRRCTYCSEPRTSGSNWLTRDPAQSVVAARDLCERSGALGVKLHDPNFFDDMNRALHFARLFASEVGLPWAATMHPADLAAASEECLGQLARDGLVRVLVGLESPDPRIVRLAGKQYDPAIISGLVAKLARNRIRGMFTFIVGWPDADRDHYLRTIECAFAIRDVWEEHQAKIHFLEPWPGTPIFEFLSRRGFQFPQTLAEWADIDYYQAKYAMIHDPEWVSEIRDANRRLSPYVNA